MASDRHRTHLAIERPSWPAAPHRFIQMHIGEVMRRWHEPAQELPDQLLSLLKQLTEKDESA